MTLFLKKKKNVDQIIWMASFKWKKKKIIGSLRDCGSSKLYSTIYICVCVCVYLSISVWLSRFYGLYLGYYGSEFDETWWNCWNLGPIDCTKILYSVEWWRYPDLFLQRDQFMRQREFIFVLCPDCDTSDNGLVLEMTKICKNCNLSFCIDWRLFMIKYQWFVALEIACHYLVHVFHF